MSETYQKLKTVLSEQGADMSHSDHKLGKCEIYKQVESVSSQLKLWVTKCVA